MKKVVRLAAMAIAVLSLSVACKQKPAEEIDTMPADTMPIEEVIDTMVEEVAEDTVVAEPVKKATKKATKKSEPQSKDAKATVDKGTVVIEKMDGTSMTAKNPTNQNVKVEKMGENASSSSRK